MDDGFDNTSSPGAAMAGAGGAAGDARRYLRSRRPGRCRQRTFAPAQPTYLEAPHSWKREVAERHWSKLDHEVRGYIHQRESDAHKAITTATARGSEAVRAIRASAVSATARRCRRAWPPHDAFGRLLEAHLRLETDPRASIAHLMQSYRLDPWELISPQDRAEIARLLNAEQAIAAREQRLAEQ